MNATNVRDQFVLRIKRGSPVDKIMEAMSTGDQFTNSQLAEIGGQAQWSYMFQWLAKMTDNVALVKSWKDNSQLMRYVNPINTAPVPVSAPIAQYPMDAPALSQPDVPEINNIRWPDAPPLIEGMGDKFRQPQWFSIMREMVHRGRHIALAGPPGVGKDTAVQELAAEQGKILITIGGDGGFRRRDLVGNVQISQGRSFIEVGEYAAAVVNGWWALLTEVNAADADALMFINAQLAPPYIITIGGKAYPVHPDFRLFVSYNPGLVGTKPLPQSFKDRFFSIQVPFFSQQQLISILIAHGADDAAYTTEIAKYGLLMWSAFQKGNMRYQITSRRLMDAVELMKAGLAVGVREAVDMAVISAIDSSIEQNVARQLINQI